MKTILERVEELYKRLEKIRLDPGPRMFPNLSENDLGAQIKQAVAECLDDYGHDVLAFAKEKYEKQLAEKIDPKLRDMRLECLKLATEQISNYTSKSFYDDIDYTDKILVTADRLLSYATNGLQRETPDIIATDEYFAERPEMSGAEANKRPNMFFGGV